jgi:hypothetical protein
MRLSAERTGTVEELLLVETARFLLTQTDEIRKLQTELDLLHVENSRLTHRRKAVSNGQYEEFWWTKSSLTNLLNEYP